MRRKSPGRVFFFFIESKSIRQDKSFSSSQIFESNVSRKQWTMMIEESSSALSSSREEKKEEKFSSETEKKRKKNDISSNMNGRDDRARADEEKNSTKGKTTFLFFLV